MENHGSSDFLEESNDSNTVVGNVASQTYAGSFGSSRFAKPSLPPENGCDSHSVRYIDDVKADMASFVNTEMQCNSLPESIQRPTNRKMRRFVPTYRKDEYYWMKRKKNNEAARKSREKRRQNDAVLARTVMSLLKENNKLKRDLLALRIKYNDIDSAEVEVMGRYLDEQQFAIDDKEGFHWDEKQPAISLDPYHVQHVTHNHQVYQILKEQCGHGIAVSVAENMPDERLWKATKRTLKEEHVPDENLEKMATGYDEWKNHYIHNFDHKSVKCEQPSFPDAQFVFCTSNTIREKINSHEGNHGNKEHCYYSKPNVFPTTERTEQDHLKEFSMTKNENDLGDKVLPSETSTDSSSSFESCSSTPTMSPEQNNSPEGARYSNPVQEKTQKLPYKLRFKLAALQS